MVKRALQGISAGLIIFPSIHHRTHQTFIPISITRLQGKHAHCPSSITDVISLAACSMCQLDQISVDNSVSGPIADCTWPRISDAAIGTRLHSENWRPQ